MVNGGIFEMIFSRFRGVWWDFDPLNQWELRVPHSVRTTLANLLILNNYFPHSIRNSSALSSETAYLGRRHWLGVIM